MTRVFTFQTDEFQSRSEPENPHNSIRGQSVAVWMKVQLETFGVGVTEVGAQDWGWCVDAQADGESYMLGFSILDADPNENEEIVVQVHKHRSLFEKLSGKNPLHTEDALLSLVRRVISDLVGPDHVDEQEQP